MPGVPDDIAASVQAKTDAYNSGAMSQADADAFASFLKDSGVWDELVASKVIVPWPAHHYFSPPQQSDPSFMPPTGAPIPPVGLQPDPSMVPLTATIPRTPPSVPFQPGPTLVPQTGPPPVGLQPDPSMVPLTATIPVTRPSVPFQPDPSMVPLTATIMPQGGLQPDPSMVPVTATVPAGGWFQQIPNPVKIGAAVGTVVIIALGGYEFSVQGQHSSAQPVAGSSSASTPSTSSSQPRTDVALWALMATTFGFSTLPPAYPVAQGAWFFSDQAGKAGYTAPYADLLSTSGGRFTVTQAQADQANVTFRCGGGGAGGVAVVCPAGNPPIQAGTYYIVVSTYAGPVAQPGTDLLVLGTPLQWDPATAYKASAAFPNDTYQGSNEPWPEIATFQGQWMMRFRAPQGGVPPKGSRGVIFGDAVGFIIFGGDLPGQPTGFRSTAYVSKTTDAKPSDGGVKVSPGGPGTQWGFHPFK